MIVEDSEDMQSIYRDMFSTESGYEIDIDSDACSALDKVCKDPKKYDLIILDIIMEPMSGDAFFIHLRAHESTKHIPVIVVSVLERSVLETLTKIENIEILEKPLNREELFGALHKVLQ
ncbi:MAG: response regulator [Pseudomonadota bacterium]